MEIHNTIEKDWIISMESSDTERILQAILEIRNSGSVRILPVLFRQINKNTNAIIRNEIVKLVSEIKSQEAVSYIADSLVSFDFGDYLPAFVAACWQSGLDFSMHLRVFAGLFVQADYRTALESFTVIEESVGNASETEIHECILFLKEAECMVTDERMPLFRELRKVVEKR